MKEFGFHILIRLIEPLYKISVNNLICSQSVPLTGEKFVVRFGYMNVLAEHELLKRVYCDNSFSAPFLMSSNGGIY